MGDELTLTDDEGNITELLRSGEAKATLIATWGPASAAATSLVVFNADDTWTGMAGCGDFAGTWQVRFTADDATRQVIDPMGETATMTTSAGTLPLSIGPAPTTDAVKFVKAGEQAELLTRW